MAATVMVYCADCGKTLQTLELESDDPWLELAETNDDLNLTCDDCDSDDEEEDE